jgi:LacI family transcriptional regulator
VSATIKDVARRAGVSVATVSRVFNESGPVDESTAQRVVAAAKELRYVPNQAARSLITRRTHTLGVILPDMHGEFFAQVIRGLDETARTHDHHVLVSSSHSDQDEARAAVRAMLGRVDGLAIMWPSSEHNLFADLLPDQLPVVLLLASDESAAFPSLSIDNHAGARSVVEHLLDHGHERIAILTGPSANRDAQQRLAGYRAAMRESGPGHDPILEIPGDFMQATGYRAVSQLLALDPRPTALFASNDSMAIGALHALHEAGLRVPEDMALVGFDDIPSAQYMNPPLSTVHVPIYELGAQAVELLIHRTNKTSDAPQTEAVLPTDLALRASCGCAATE